MRKFITIEESHEIRTGKLVLELSKAEAESMINELHYEFEFLDNELKIAVPVFGCDECDFLKVNFDGEINLCVKKQPRFGE